MKYREGEHPRQRQMWNKLRQQYAATHEGQMSISKEEVAAYILDRFRALDSSLRRTAEEFGVASQTIRKFIPEEEILSQSEATRRADNRAWGDPVRRAERIKRAHSPAANARRSQKLLGRKRPIEEMKPAHDAKQEKLKGEADRDKEIAAALQAKGKSSREIHQITGLRRARIRQLLGTPRERGAKETKIFEKSRLIAQKSNIDKDRLSILEKLILEERLLTANPMSLSEIARKAYAEYGAGKKGKPYTHQRMYQIESALVVKLAASQRETSS